MSLFVYSLQMWPDLINKAKIGGINVIQTYVFWNIHEPVQGQVLHYMWFGISNTLTFTIPYNY